MALKWFRITRKILIFFCVGFMVKIANYISNSMPLHLTNSKLIPWVNHYDFNYKVLHVNN